MTISTVDSRPFPQRHEVIDALRGFALAGVFLANLPILSLYVMVPQEVRANYATARFDTLVQQLLAVFVDGKFITLFSLLFGLGFAMQLGKVQQEGAGGLARYLRRLLVLLGIGAIHSYFVWWGDILLTYALAGLALVMFRAASDRVLLGGGLLLALVLTPLLVPWNDVWVTSLPVRADQYVRGLQVFTGTDAVQTVSFNAELSNWSHLVNGSMLTFVLGRFLLGFWAGRTGLLQAPGHHIGLIRAIFIGSAITGVALTLIYRLDTTRALLDAADLRVAGYATAVVFRGAALALGIAYATGFVLLFQRPAWRRRLGVLAPVGRMALTHYLAQSVIGVIVFYGIGFGVGPKWGASAWLVVWALVFAFQIAISHVWLARFRYGPMEWLWRWLTDGARPTLRRRAQLSA